MIKKMRGTEKTDLLNILDDYIEHLNNNPDSLISRIYGIFTLKTSAFSPVDIMLIQHTAQLVNKDRKKYEFDLKGSQFGRLHLPFNAREVFTKKGKYPIYKKCLKDKNYLLLNETLKD